MKVKINVRLESAPAAEGHTLVVKRRTRDIANFQRATGWTMERMQNEVSEADVLGIPIATFFALTNAGFTPDWDELLDQEPDAFEAIEEPGDEREAEEPADPHQLPADSAPDGDAPAPAQA
ncbi:hypothetical protein JNB62_13175 [Microbacterium jejuense]|uniref:XRE family transcriptional regulator n=1 Tax=Microbacterium jejuense TaxID=1263637 RepID=A0ABS7HNW4_9MICO|nr:hypothetical protein [Microbacterium jejuense]MBW9094642.1 hypothetical protein [Microbacterium jejuense]